MQAGEQDACEVLGGRVGKGYEDMNGAGRIVAVEPAANEAP